MKQYEHPKVLENIRIMREASVEFNAWKAEQKREMSWAAKMKKYNQILKRIRKDAKRVK